MQRLGHQGVLITCRPRAFPPQQSRRRDSQDPLVVCFSVNHPVHPSRRLISHLPVIQDYRRQWHRGQGRRPLHVLVDHDDRNVFRDPDPPSQQFVHQGPGHPGMNEKQPEWSFDFHQLIGKRPDLLWPNPFFPRKQACVFHACLPQCQSQPAICPLVDRIGSRFHRRHPGQPQSLKLPHGERRRSRKVRLHPRPPQPPQPPQPAGQMKQRQLECRNPLQGLFVIHQIRQNPVPGDVIRHPVRPHRPAAVQPNAVFSSIDPGSFKNRWPEIVHDHPDCRDSLHPRVTYQNAGSRAISKRKKRYFAKTRK